MENLAEDDTIVKLVQRMNRSSEFKHSIYLYTRQSVRAATLDAVEDKAQQGERRGTHGIEQSGLRARAV